MKKISQEEAYQRHINYRNKRFILAFTGLVSVLLSITFFTIPNYISDLLLNCKFLLAVLAVLVIGWSIWLTEVDYESLLLNSEIAGRTFWILLYSCSCSMTGLRVNVIRVDCVSRKVWKNIICYKVGDGREFGSFTVT